MSIKSLNGIIIKSTGGFYYVEAADMVYECKARGIFRKRNNSPKVGDYVKISVPEDGYCSIDEIEKRKNTLKRPPLSNIDLLIIVVSTVDPSPNYLVIDKMTAAAVDNGIEPVIVVSKSDLKSADELLNVYKTAGIKVFSYSKDDENSVNLIKEYLKGKVSAFTGNTGVGKSTLLNVLYPGLELETGEISEKLGRGRHTTRTVELFKIGDGYVADTPGFSTVDLERYNMIDKDDIMLCFPEFKDYLFSCRFSSCSHTCEKGCEIIKAVEEGKISATRHQSYVSMYNEVKDIKQWQKKKDV